MLKLQQNCYLYNAAMAIQQLQSAKKGPILRSIMPKCQFTNAGKWCMRIIIQKLHLISVDMRNRRVR